MCVLLKTKKYRKKKIPCVCSLKISVYVLPLYIYNFVNPYRYVAIFFSNSLQTRVSIPYNHVSLYIRKFMYPLKIAKRSLVQENIFWILISPKKHLTTLTEFVGPLRESKIRGNRL